MYIWNSIGQAIDQSGEFFVDILNAIFWGHFKFDFDLWYDHSIEKTVLFRSAQGRHFYHVPLKSYKHVPESPDFD